jgi:hypothetical protein
VVVSAVFALRVTGRYTIRAGMPFQKTTFSSAHATKFTTAALDSCTRILEAPHVMLSTLDDRQQAHRY